MRSSLMPAALAAALLLAACDASGPIGPPLPPDPARVLTAADDGGAVTLAVGETLAVTLIGTPTAGYLWEADATPGFLASGDTLSGPTSRAQLQRDFTGGSHWEVLVFTATAPGEGRLRLAQRPAWEADEPPAATFEVDVVVE